MPSPNFVSILLLFQSRHIADRMDQLLGALRVPTRAAPRGPHSFHSFRSAAPSTLLRGPSSALRTTCFPRLSIVAQLQQRRGLSLGTLFTRAKPTPTPSPAIVANIARIEAEANNAPHDVNKQLALFQALVDTKAKPGYDLLVTRWERMCEFVRDRSYPVLSYFG